jgi:DNA-binding PadR family transcriptional regulator
MYRIPFYREPMQHDKRGTASRSAEPAGPDPGLETLGRSSGPASLILASLADGPKHGYAITTDVLEQTGVRLGPGTLYGSLTKLAERGLIEALPSEQRRRPYQITPSGRAALAGQLAGWSRVVDAGKLRLGGLL